MAAMRCVNMGPGETLPLDAWYSPLRVSIGIPGQVALTFYLDLCSKL